MNIVYCKHRLPVVALFFLLVSVVALRCALAGPEEITKEPRLESVDCWFPTDRLPSIFGQQNKEIFEDQIKELIKSRPEILGPVFDCFLMYVPELHHRKNGKYIYFPVVKISSRTNRKEITPLLHLGNGGPGATSLPLYKIFTATDAKLDHWNWYERHFDQYGRDVYVIEPRGVGLAYPSLYCPQYNSVYIETSEYPIRESDLYKRLIDADLSCIQHLKERDVDLSAYNSLQVAKDIELLRQALGLPQWNLYGVSYSTRYALTIAREFPQSVESMVLDSPKFPGPDYIHGYADDTLRAFEQLFEDCLKSSSCSKLVENPEMKFWQLVKKLDSSPIKSSIVINSFSGEPTELEFVLDDELFLTIMYWSMYGSNEAKMLPNYFWTLENGELGYFKANIERWYISNMYDDRSQPATATHRCAEEYSFVDYSKALSEVGKLRIELRDWVTKEIQEIQQYCEQWSIPQAHKIENQSVKTDIPTLILQGRLDPVTPAKYLFEQSSNFTQVDYEVFNDLSHGIIYSHPCGYSMVESFFQNKDDFRRNLDCLTKH